MFQKKRRKLTEGGRLRRMGDSMDYTLGYHCGVTFAGLKPASLFRLRKERIRELFFYERYFLEKGFHFVSLSENEESCLLYVYHENRLCDALFSDGNFAFLHERGYYYTTVSEAVLELKEHMRAEFPHEIGLFLGYPLEDVVGFIRSPRGQIFTGYWKVYTHAKEKAELFDRFRRCERAICREIDRGRTLTSLF